MKYLKSFFSKKEKSKSEVLYKKINHQEFIDYDDNHSKDDYDGGEINRIKSFFKYKIFGKNTNYCVSIAKSNKLNDVSKTFFVIEKYADGWYIVHICKYIIFARWWTERTPTDINRNYDILESFLCDTLDGVEQIVKK